MLASLRNFRTVPALSVALLLSAATIPAQAPEPLALHVVASDTGQPLQGVVVSIEQPFGLLAGRGSPVANGTPPTGLPPLPGAVTPPTPGGAPLPQNITPPMPPSNASAGYWARTDAEGLAQIPNTEISGPVSVRKSGYVPQTIRPDARGVHEIRLVRAAALTVFVVDMSGAAVPEARVSVRCSSGGGPTTQTDDRGQVRLSGLPPGRCDIRTNPPQPPLRIESLTSLPGALTDRLQAVLSSPIVATIQLRAGDDASISAPLTPLATTATSPAALSPAGTSGTASVDGTVTGADRRPAVGVRVALRRAGEPLQPLQAITDTEGRYAFPSLAPGRYGINPICPCRGDVLDVSPEPALTLIADTRATRNFVLQKGAVLKGRVLDEFGEPEEGVQIQAYREERLGLNLPVAGARTDDRGNYRIPALLPGAYRVGAVIRRDTKRDEVMYTESRQGIERGLITLVSGMEIDGIDFKVRPPRRPTPR